MAEERDYAGLAQRLRIEALDFYEMGVTLDDSDRSVLSADTRWQAADAIGHITTHLRLAREVVAAAQDAEMECLVQTAGDICRRHVMEILRGPLERYRSATGSMEGEESTPTEREKT